MKSVPTYSRSYGPYFFRLHWESASSRFSPSPPPRLHGPSSILWKFRFHDFFYLFTFSFFRGEKNNLGNLSDFRTLSKRRFCLESHSTFETKAAPWSSPATVQPFCTLSIVQYWESTFFCVLALNRDDLSSALRVSVEFTSAEAGFIEGSSKNFENSHPPPFLILSWSRNNSLFCKHHGRRSREVLRHLQPRVRGAIRGVLEGAGRELPAAKGCHRLDSSLQCKSKSLLFCISRSSQSID